MSFTVIFRASDCELFFSNIRYYSVTLRTLTSTITLVVIHEDVIEIVIAASFGQLWRGPHLRLEFLGAKGYVLCLGVRKALL
jgi:hypothetical protein